MDQNENIFITYVHEHKHFCRTAVHGYYMTVHTHIYTMNQILTIFLATPYFQAPNASKKMKTTFPFFFKVNFQMEKQTQHSSLLHVLSSKRLRVKNLFSCSQYNRTHGLLSLFRKSDHLRCSAKE